MSFRPFTLYSYHKTELRPRVAIKSDLDFISIEFGVQNKGSWCLSEHFSTVSHKNWGLWENDVIEVFFQYRKNVRALDLSYYEFQLSPLNQKFFLEIRRPRIDFSYPDELFVISESVVSKNLWSGMIKIPKQANTMVFGNICTCLGKNPQTLFSGVPFDSTPDFHQPGKFVRFDQ